MFLFEDLVLTDCWNMADDLVGEFLLLCSLIVKPGGQDGSGQVFTIATGSKLKSYFKKI